jgi:hypothetical protein
MPIVVRSAFHIDKEEYERRKSFRWPKLESDMFIPADVSPGALSKPTVEGPRVIREVDGIDVSDGASQPPNLSDLFTGLDDAEKTNKKRKRRPE